MSSLLSVDIEPSDVSNDKDVVTIANARSYAALGANFTDVLVSVFIASARMKLERFTGLCFVQSNINALYMQVGCGDRISLYYCNELDEDTLMQSDGTALPTNTTLKGFGSQLYLDTTIKELNLKYQAGYENNNAPEIIQQAVLKQVAWDTMHFGDENIADVCPEAKMLLSSFISFSWL